MSGRPPRVLVVMGSGETSPTMLATHRMAFDRLEATAPAVLLDTPFGFQENADELTERARAYFSRSFGRTMGVARLRRADDPPVERERALARLREAGLVFSGPGSPSYALRQWRATGVPELLAGKLRHGGVVVFSSAAALTLGRFTVPVYEVYKVGEEPRWLDGMDLLAEVGLSVAVIPHFNNTEGGTHDTRYCYLGERRLQAMERELPPGTVVLGVDEHTAFLLDLDAGSVTVTGLGSLTVRAGGASRCFPAGSVLPLAALGGPGASDGAGVVAVPASGAPAVPGAGTAPLPARTRHLEAAFEEALAAGEATTAAGTLLELAELLLAWSTDALQSDDLDRARSVLRAKLFRLGEWASDGLRDLPALVGPYVEVLVELRVGLRAQRRFAEADEVRQRLGRLGVELRDTPTGTEWELQGDPAGGAGSGRPAGASPGSTDRPTLGR